MAEILFKIETRVREKDLGKAFKALLNISLGTPIVIPERAAMIKGNRIHGAVAIDALPLPTKGTMITPKQLKDILIASGRAGGSYSYALDRLIKAKRVQKTSKLGTYKVIE